MSIADELNALRTSINASYSAVENKGGEVPTNKNTSNLPGAINSIPTRTGGNLPEGFPQSIYPGTENLIPTFPEHYHEKYTQLKYLACNNYNQCLRVPESSIGFYKLDLVFSAEYPTGDSLFDSTLWLFGPYSVSSSEQNDYAAVGAALKTGNKISALINSEWQTSQDQYYHYDYYLGTDLGKNLIEVPVKMSNLDAPSYLSIKQGVKNTGKSPAYPTDCGAGIVANHCNNVLSTTTTDGTTTAPWNNGYTMWQIGKGYEWAGNHPELRIYYIKFYYNLTDYYEIIPVVDKVSYGIPVCGWLKRRVRPSQPNDMYEFVQSQAGGNEIWIMGPEL